MCSVIDLMTLDIKLMTEYMHRSRRPEPPEEPYLEVALLRHGATRTEARKPTSQPR